MNKSKYGYADNIEQATLNNNYFRQVLFTGKLQLVLMTLKSGEDIGWEVHHDHDQFFRFEAGQGKVYINEEEFNVTDGDAIIVPAGAKHNVVNTGDTPLKLYTIYAAPEHKPGKIHKTKQEALNDPDEE